MTDNVAAPLPKGKCPHVLISELQAELAEKSQQLATLRESLDETTTLSIGWAAHYAHIHGLQNWHSTHQQIIDKANAALSATAPAAREGEV